MPLVIQPAKETDVPSLVDVYNAAFSSSSAIHRNLYPNGDTDVARENVRKNFQETIQDPTNTFFAIVDTNSNSRIIAWTNWKTYKVAQPESEWNKPFESPERAASSSHPDVNSEFAAQFFGELAKLKRDYLKGKARVHIGLLITHPNYQRRGCGKMLLDKCAEHADQLYLPTVLEASPMAAPLYRREGFVPVDGAVSTLELKDYGCDITHTTVMMERPAGGTRK
ncbi:MAG: hypothetical protein GOMPHAMPRED_003940 [Gomphillus americanus]|uniref:N-acetyltransferase domain-containing protein n=1 Tax=Gomphillus americanus TaxID=1940652 RepID=A0A8H3FQW7_9LECA|nr:MAG: hypothetical protein GOMPHAMPRED_003940 [Gomphillus americanus]